MTHAPDPSATERRVWSPVRLLRAGALGAWAALFFWLLISGRASLYLSTRTSWVIPLGAILSTACLAGILASARVREVEPIGWRAALSTAAIVLPVVVMVATPPVSLGAFAAGRRGALTLGPAGAATSPTDMAGGRIELVDVAGALRDRSAMRALVERAGSRVSWIGFVNREPGMPADEFFLTRFLVTCCAADAVSLQVRVVEAPPGEFRVDDWVRVDGSVYPLGSEVLVDASGVTKVPRPKRPYLNG